MKKKKTKKKKRPTKTFFFNIKIFFFFEPKFQEIVLCCCYHGTQNTPEEKQKSLKKTLNLVSSVSTRLLFYLIFLFSNFNFKSKLSLLLKFVLKSTKVNKLEKKKRKEEEKKKQTKKSQNKTMFSRKISLHLLFSFFYGIVFSCGYRH